ncbi:MAG: amino acid adenylation domain-containing protein [Candidatus Aminicenantes bacterium]|nr:MAG: amino acid adenylation domain-containing protein [Candidatus Aminicenantes bacterium]
METINHSYQLAVAANQNIKERNYWLEILSGTWIKTSFPYDFKKDDRVSPQAPPQKDSLQFHLSAELASRLMALSNNSDYTLHIVLVSGLMVLLNKYNRSQDIIIGTPIYKQEVETQFINTALVLRNRLSKNMSFKDLLLQLKQTVLGAVQNQNYPIPMLTKWLDIPTSQKENPFYDIVLLLENIHNKTYVRESDYNILFSFLRTNSNIKGQVEYNPYLYRKETIERTIDHFTRLLETGAADVNIRLDHIDLPGEAEKKQILSEFNRTVTDSHQAAGYLGGQCVTQLFEAQAARTPDNIAVVAQDAEPKTRDEERGSTPGTGQCAITYKELNEQATQLAHFLKEKGIGPDTIAAVILPPSLEMIAALWGILKAGGAYLPIAPEYPGERINYILADSGAKILLAAPGTQVKVKPEAEERFVEIIYISNLLSYSTSTSTSRLGASAASLAYVIYTSGSTGQPKGVLVDHDNLTAYLFAYYQEFDIKSIDTAIHLSDYTFDAFVEELYPVLLRGGKIVIPGPDEYLNLHNLGNFILRHDVTIIDCSPLLLNQLNKLAVLKNVHTFISGGDVLQESYVDELLKIGSVYNTYGPTETTVCVTYYRCNPNGEETPTIPIGKPIANYTVYILDEKQYLQPIGVPGEICVSGPGLTRGYLNQPGLTAEKFCLRRPGGLFSRKPPPWTPHKSLSLKGTRGLAPLLYAPLLYRTGDLGRWLGDGNIEYLGRKDQQVKIRGFRIETGEIENLLLKKPGIKETAVTARESKDGEKYLCAYYVRVNDDRNLEQKQETKPDARELRVYLQEKLPDYMIPSFFMDLEKFPLTPGGKIDRKALPEPEVKAPKEYEAPRNEVEKRLLEIWQEIFETEHIDINDDFFEIGGHSLRAAVMISKIHQTFNINLPLGEVFKSTTIKSLAEYINSQEVHRNIELLTLRDENLVLLKSGATAAATGNNTDSTTNHHHLFLIHDGTGEVEGYIEFCNLLTGQFNCWGIRAQRLQDYAPRKTTIEEMAQNYIEKIKGLQPRGPYHIAGWSIGGTIAFEMARQLEQQEEEISFLGMIDVVVPHPELKTGISEFTIQSEANFLHSHLPGIEINQDPENPDEINRFWSMVVEYLETSHFDEKVIKELVAAYEVPVAPDDLQQNKSIGNLIKALNIGRTLLLARTLYMPDGKINTPVHYFAASQSREIIKEQGWNNFCSIPIKIHQILGDHYSIFKMPQVAAFAKTFDNALAASQ